MSLPSEGTASMFPAQYQGLVDMTRDAWERHVLNCDVLEERVGEVEGWIGEVERAEGEVGGWVVEEEVEEEEMEEVEDLEEMEGMEGEWVCTWVEEVCVEEFQSRQEEVGLIVV